jgi:hypothetical protein
MRPIKHWIIRDRGKKAVKWGKYFTGWQKEITESWDNDLSKAKPFTTKKAAFDYLYEEFSGQDYVYGKLDANIRFVVMRVYESRRKVNATAGSPLGEVRVGLRGGSTNVSLAGGQAHEEAGAGPTGPTSAVRRAQGGPGKEEGVLKKSPQHKAWESRRASQSAEAQSGAKKRDRSKGSRSKVATAA